MSTTQKLRACYIRPANYDGRLSECDLDFCIKVDDFIDQLRKLQSDGFVDPNGWINMRIVQNSIPEGKGRYTHKLKVMKP